MNFDIIKNVFPIKTSQKEGVNKIISYAPRDCDPRHTAYVLATAWYETGGRMTPVREGFARTDEQAKRITAHRAYAGDYYGRGYVQITWQENYAKFAKILRVDLVKQPDLALDPIIAANILWIGMIEGIFTGKKLETYFNDKTENPIGARRIINGTDKAGLIAQYYNHFLRGLTNG